jgi:hypothetical protein
MDPKNFRTQAIDYQVAIVDWNNVATTDQHIKPNDSDQIFLELMNFLLESNLYKAANIANEYIKDVHAT